MNELLRPLQEKRLAPSLLLLFGMLVARIAQSGEPGSQLLTPPELNFHKVFVPADRPNEWPTNGQRYLPIDRDEFTRLLNDSVAGKNTAPGILAARLSEASYSARIVDQEYLLGRAVFDIQHNASHPVLLPLRPWSAGITQARWVAKASDDDDQNAGLTATLGNAAEGSLAVVVNRSGRLVIDWTLRGFRNLSGTAVFALDLPQSAASTFVLETPTGVIPELDRAIVEPLAPTESTLKWSIKTGGRELGLLRLTTNETRGQQRQLTLFRQADNYSISSHGVDLTTTLEVDIHGNPLSDLEMRLDPGLQLVAARLGETELSWTVSSDPESQESRARISLPNSISGAGKAIVLRAISAVEIGVPQALPRIRCEGMFWQEGTSVIHVQAPLVVNRVQANGARERSVFQAEGRRSSDTVEVQHFSYDGSVEIVVDRLENELSLNSAHRLEFLSGEVLSQMVTDVRVLRGECGSLSFGVEPLWQVDTVESGDPAMLGDWDVHGTGPHRKLAIRLAKSVRSDESVRLKIFGRRTMALGEPLPLSDLRMLIPTTYQSRQESVLLQEPEALEMQIRGDDRVNRIDLKQLQTTDPLYVDSVPHGAAFVLNEDASELDVAVVPRRPRFLATIESTVEVAGDRVAETCQIRCRPSGAAMDRLLVHLSRVSGHEVWQWSGDDSLGPVVARRLSSDEQLAAAAGSTGQAWELSWRVPQRQEFVVTGVRNCPLDNEVPVTLISAPEAAEQTGLVWVRAVEDTAMRLINRGLVALPTEQSDFPALRGRFRYDPRRDGLSDSALLVVSPGGTELESTGAFAWSCLLESRVSAGGASSHTAVFRLQSAGQSRVVVSLPNGAALRAAWVDDQPLPESQIDLSHGTIPVLLPARREFITISVCFTTVQTLPEFVSSCPSPFPRLDVPTLSRKWRLWVPGQFDVPTDSPSAHRYSRRESTLLQRIFWPVGDRELNESRNPLEREFWTNGRTSSRELAASRELVVPFLESLGNIAKGNGDEKVGLTWGTAIATAATSSGVELMIARGMLEEAGVDAEQPLPVVAGKTALERGANLLRQVDLVIAVREVRLTLVSQQLAALNRGRYSEIDDLPVLCVNGGSWADDLAGRKMASSPNELLTLKNWREAAINAPNPWVVPTRTSGSLAETRGWNLYEFQLSDGQSLTATIRNTPTVSSLACAVALVFFSSGLCLSRGVFRCWVVVCALLAAAAILLPLAWVPVASSALIASLLSWMLRAILVGRHRELGLSTRHGHSHSKRLLLATSAILIAACIVAAVSRSIAEEPVVDALPRVLFPVNQDRSQTSDKVYVPDILYRKLLDAASRQRGVPSGWIITHARYRTALTRESLQPQGAALSMRASFDVNAFQRDTVVRLPIRGEGLRLSSGSVRVDGQPTDDVQESDDAISVRVGDAGSHRVELTLLPDLQVLGISDGFEFEIPQVAGAFIELTGPDAARVELPDAQAPLQVDKERGRLVASLGSKNRLSVRWPAGIGGTGEAPAFELDELQLARVQPGALLVDTRLNIRVTTGRVRQLSLIADPRLRLISSSGENNPLASVRTTPGDPQIINVELASPIHDRGTVELRFVLAEASGIGNLRMPRLEVSGVRPSRRWCAVSVDSSLDFTEQKAEEIQPLAIPEFLAAWGMSEIVPQSAFRLPRGEVLWSLSSRTKNLSGTAAETTSLLVEPTQLRVHWTASLDINSGTALQWRVQVPPDLVIDEIVVKRADGVANLERWSRNSADSSIAVRLLEADAGQQTLLISGVIPRTNSAAFKVPEFSLLDAMRGTHSLQVYRADRVLVDVRTSGAWQPVESAPQKFSPELNASLVAAYITEDPAADASIEVHSNDVKAAAMQLTSVSHDGDNWLADVDLQIQVQSGAIDSIVFFAPMAWIAPKIVESTTSGNEFVATEDVPGQTVRRIVVRPTAPIRGSYRLHLRGQIGASDGDRLSIPDVVPAGLGSVSRYVVLPTQMELQPIRWDISGLVAAELPKELQSVTSFADSHLNFALVGEHFQATLRMSDAEPVSAMAELAENLVISQSDGSYFGLATFSLLPANLTHLVIEMPAGLQPIHCRLAGMPTALLPTEEGKFRIPITVQRAPQLLELVFRCDAAAVKANRFESPGIEGLEVNNTLWVIAGPTTWTRSDLEDVSLSQNASEYQSSRNRAAQRLRNIGAELALDQNDINSAAWPFAANRLDGRTVHGGQSALPGKASASTDKQQVSRARPTMEQVVERMVPSVPPTIAAIKGKGTVLRMRTAEAQSPSILSRSLLAVFLVGATFLLVFRYSSEITGIVPPQWALIASGIVWWTWLSPPFIALLFFAAAIVVSLQTRRSLDTV